MTVLVQLENETDSSDLPTPAQFQLWVNQVFKHPLKNQEKPYESICICIVDKEKSAQLNTAYRHKTGPTNVLAFTYDPMPGLTENSLGDLAICAEIVKEEASTQNKALSAHWAHLTIHGVLHLLGYDHENPEDANAMESLEIDILNDLNFQNPYVFQG